jgi:hypothetical protein
VFFLLQRKRQRARARFWVPELNRGLINGLVAGWRDAQYDGIVAFGGFRVLGGLNIKF